MAIQLAERIQRIQPSPTVAMSQKAREMRGEGHDVISLSVGEPDFDTPDYIKQAAKAAIDAGSTKYTAVMGTRSLREAIAQKLERDNHLIVHPDDVVVSCGAKHSLYNLFQTLVHPGDEVVIPAPYWVSYPDMVTLAEGVPVVVDCPAEQGFKVTPEQLDAAITPKTRCVVFNSPCNPTGAVYTLDEWQALGAVLERHPHVLVVTDDIYEHIQWVNQGCVNLLNACPGLQSRCFVVNGVAKAYAMTGWRIGFTAGPHDVLRAMSKLQSQSTSCPCSISQVAAEAAFRNHNTSLMASMCDTFRQRHDRVLEALASLPGVEPLPSGGTFYSFPSITGLMEQLGMERDVDVAEYLLEHAHVALVPGSAFGAPGHLRLSFAASLDRLDAAIERIRRVIEQGEHPLQRC